jgi:hypothetical protein
MPSWLLLGTKADPLTACGHDEIAAFMACASRFPWSLRTLGAVPTAMNGTSP